MTTIIDLSMLSCGGTSSELCHELEKGKFELRASHDEAVVYGSDGARVFRVTNDGIDQGVLKSLFEKNASLKQWVGECRTIARDRSGNCDVTKDYDAGSVLLTFVGENGKVRVKVEKRHENDAGKYEKHAAYTPFASVNGTLYRICCIAMEQFKGPKVEEKKLTLVQLAPQVRYDEKSKAHVATPAKEVAKSWSDAIVYKEPKVDTVAPKSAKHHKHK